MFKRIALRTISIQLAPLRDIGQGEFATRFHDGEGKQLGVVVVKDGKAKGKMPLPDGTATSFSIPAATDKDGMNAQLANFVSHVEMAFAAGGSKAVKDLPGLGRKPAAPDSYDAPAGEAPELTPFYEPIPQRRPTNTEMKYNEAPPEELSDHTVNNPVHKPKSPVDPKNDPQDGQFMDIPGRGEGS